MITLVDPCALRRDTLVTAMVRSGYAYSVRDSEPAAWFEMARMAGVVMATCGPGRGPNDVNSLITALERPLKELAPELLADTAVADVRVLVDGELNDEVLERCCERVIDVLGKNDRTSSWLPSWAYTRGEMVENDAFRRLHDGASPEQYTAGRRFVIEHPAGEFGELIKAANALRSLRPAIEYRPLPGDRVYQDAFWWACPACRYPMRVEGSRVWCTYGPHQAHYFVRNVAGSRGGPLLSRRDPGVPGRAPGAQEIRADGERQSVCVPVSVWRHIVVSGVTELELYRWLERQKTKYEKLLTIELFPGKDKADVLVEIEKADYSELLDVKDVFDAVRLAEEVLAKPLAAKVIVLPDHRGESQRRQLQSLLPGYRIELVAGVRRQIERALRLAARSAA